MTEKVAIYCRLSEEDRDKQNKTDESGSIQNQKAMLLRYCTEQGWDVYRIYSDDDCTGADRNRPAFCSLLKDAEAGKFHIVLCKSQSRFTREMELVEKYIHGLFPLWGIRFVSIVDNADTANKGNKKSRQINGLVNEWYLEDMSENIRSVLINRRQNGFHIGSFALYGYRKDPERKGCLVVDSEAAAVVREVFLLFAQGYGKTAIARILNDRGIPNPTEYKRLKGLRYRQPKGKYGTLWKYSAISNMLTNELYIGNMVQGKYGSISYKTKTNKPRPKELWYRVEGTHEAIIDRTLWEQVQIRIAQRTHPFSSGRIGLFSGKVQCAYCGYMLRTSKSRGRQYLSCPTRNVAKEACCGAFISYDALERVILHALNTFTTSWLPVEELETRIHIRACNVPPKENFLEKRKVCLRKHTEISEAIGALYLDHVRGNLTETCFQSVMKQFQTEQAGYDRQMEEIDRMLEETEKCSVADRDIHDLIERCIHPEHLTREMVDLFIEHIAVGKRNKGEKLPPITVYWNF